VHTSLQAVHLPQLYVPWNLHEQQPGNFSWTGFADLERFLAVARDLKLLVLLRPGPYMCAISHACRLSLLSVLREVAGLRYRGRIQTYC